MKYAKEVIGLMSAHPNREFKMADVVRYVGGKDLAGREWERVRRGVRRVLKSLEENGSVVIMHSSSGSGGASTYVWFQKRDMNFCKAGLEAGQ